MAEPTDKAKEIERIIDSLNPYGRERRASIERNKCSWCGADVSWDNFRDMLSRKEYTISGFCQVCQDETFLK